MDRSWMDFYDEEMTGEVDLPDFTLYEMLLRTATVFPKKNAVTFEGTHITFSELLFEVDSFADALTDCNVGTGTVVTVCLPNIPQAVVSIYAINKLGAIANMVHPKTPATELKNSMQQTGSECLLILDALLPKSREMLDEMNPGLVIVCEIGDYLSKPKALAFHFAKGRKIPKYPKDSFYISYSDLILHGDLLRSGKITGEYDWPGAFEEEKEKAPKAPYVRPISPDAPAVYLHSGGTTGSPKIIMISSKNMNHLAVCGPQIIRVQDPFSDPENFPDLTMVAILPLFHGFGICMCMHCMIVNAINMLLVPIFKPDELAKIIRKEKPQLIAAVPTLYEGMMKSEKLRKMKLDFLIACFSGGDTLPMDLKKRFEEFLHERGSNISLREGYGLTETVTVCSVNPEKNCRDGSVGLPLPKIDMKVVRPGTNEEIPYGEKGEICIAGPTVMLGYLNDPEATDLAIHTHEDGRRWIHSGDMGHRDEDGYFYFDQRIKRIIKVSGVPVFPTQIEKTLSKVEEVEVSCAVAIPHPYRLHVVKAYIVLKDRTASEEKKEMVRQKLEEICESDLIPYARPVEYEFREDLPKTKIGKIDYRALEQEAQPPKEESVTNA
ncbi:MAG: acyl--CoA ligase [Clostridiales bacterium]|nr:acyl--CoA ligase [Clostridiales bacterium]